MKEKGENTKKTAKNECKHLIFGEILLFKPKILEKIFEIGVPGVQNFAPLGNKPPDFDPV